MMQNTQSPSSSATDYSSSAGGSMLKMLNFHKCGALRDLVPFVQFNLINLQLY